MFRQRERHVSVARSDDARPGTACIVALRGCVRTDGLLFLVCFVFVSASFSLYTCSVFSVYVSIVVFVICYFNLVFSQF